MKHKHTTVYKTEHPYVERVPGVCGGAPIIKGTRIAVRLIAALAQQTAGQNVATVKGVSVKRVAHGSSPK